MTTVRSDPDYPGGSPLQRWHREVLRRAMVGQGFAVNPVEWWRFGYRDRARCPIMDAPFEKVAAGAPATAK